jgi:hypothetical protein
VKESQNIVSGLNKIGLEVGFCESVTDFGCSDYITFWVGDVMKKVRISDHSVESFQRMKSEIHFTISQAKDPGRIVRIIEQIAFPERFTFVPVIEGEYFTHIKNGVKGIIIRNI